MKVQGIQAKRHNGKRRTPATMCLFAVCEALKEGTPLTTIGQRKGVPNITYNFKK